MSETAIRLFEFVGASILLHSTALIDIIRCVFRTPAHHGNGTPVLFSSLLYSASSGYIAPMDSMAVFRTKNDHFFLKPKLLRFVFVIGIRVPVICRDSVRFRAILALPGRFPI